MRREVLCAAGEWLRCDDGHDAFRAVRDIYLGEVIWSADLIDRHGDRPRQRDIHNCPACGRYVQLSYQAKAA